MSKCIFLDERGYKHVINKAKNLKTNRHSESGLTLIEISIGLLLLGLFVGWATQAYLQWRLDRMYTTLNDNIVAVNQSFESFYFINNRYPCPADITLPFNNPSYGEEITSLDPNICGLTPAAIAANGGVVSGGVPFQALNISEEITIDPWGNKLSYTVTGVQAVLPTHSLRASIAFPAGAITMAVSRLVDTNSDGITDSISEPTNAAVNEGDLDNDGFGDITGAAIADTNMIDANLDGLDDLSSGPAVNNVGAHYVINSHGPRGLGARTRSGVLVQACLATGVSRDSENCDNDNVFWRGRRGTEAGSGDSVFSDVMGPSFFDDVNLVRTEDPSNMFQYARIVSGTGMASEIFSREDLVAINPPTDALGNITQEPAANIHIMGTSGILLLERDPLLPIDDSRGGAITNEICDINGANCFDPGFFTVRTSRCSGPPAGTGTGLYDREFFCNYDYNPGLNVDCSPLGILRGVDAGGNAICN